MHLFLRRWLLVHHDHLDFWSMLFRDIKSLLKRACKPLRTLAHHGPLLGHHRFRDWLRCHPDTTTSRESGGNAS
jgi:hypothetical protein